MKQFEIKYHDFKGPWFGDGVDGDVDITSGINLAQTMFYNNLSLSSSGALNPSGFKIFVKNRCYINGSISSNGANGSTSVNNIGAAGGVAMSPALYTDHLLNSGGGKGGNGGAATRNGAAGSNGGAIVNSCCAIGAIGGTGGNGAAVGGSGGAGGTITYYNPHSLSIPYMLAYGEFLFSAGTGGGGGGGGGGGAASSGGGGGGGGAGGGIVWICAREIVIGTDAAALISANGGNGGTGGPSSAGSGVGGNGGGGGGGGIFLMFNRLLGDTGLITANGGTGSSAGAPGPIIKYSFRSGRFE